MITILDCLIGLLILISQATWFHHITVAGVMPNLIVIWISYVGFINGKEKGLITGLFVGLIQDILFGRLIGLFGLIYLLIGSISGSLAQDIDHSRLLFPCLLSSCAALILGIFQLLIFQVLSGTISLFSGLRIYVIPEFIYTAILSIPVYVIFYGLHNLFGRLMHRVRRRRIV